MNILRNIGYAVDDFCIRHNKGITRLWWDVAALVCSIATVCCFVMAILLAGNFRAQMAGETGNWFAYVFYIGWIVASVIATCFCLYWCVQCLLKSRDCKYSF